MLQFFFSPVCLLLFHSSHTFWLIRLFAYEYKFIFYIFSNVYDAMCSMIRTACTVCTMCTCVCVIRVETGGSTTRTQPPSREVADNALICRHVKSMQPSSVSSLNHNWWWHWKAIQSHHAQYSICCCCSLLLFVSSLISIDAFFLSLLLLLLLLCLQSTIRRQICRIQPCPMLHWCI